MAEDFEKNRAEYVLRLEQQLQNSQQQLAESKALDKWAPRFATEIIAGKEVKFTLSFGGKNATAVIPFNELMNMDPGTATAAIIDTVFVQVISDQFKPILRPEVERVMAGVSSLDKVNKW